MADIWRLLHIDEQYICCTLHGHIEACPKRHLEHLLGNCYVIYFVCSWKTLVGDAAWMCKRKLSVGNLLKCNNEGGAQVCELNLLDQWFPAWRPGHLQPEGSRMTKINKNSVERLKKVTNKKLITTVLE